jgi:RNA polymerase sigma-70 factor (ECF subfamily)
MEYSFAVADLDRRDYMASSSCMTEPSYPMPTNQGAPTVDRLESSLSRPGVVRRKWKSDKDDSAIVERLKAGDQRALEELFSLYSAKLYNVASRILSDVAETEEVIQDVFWTAYRKAKTFHGNSQFYTWLYRLTINAALGRIRRNKKNKEVEYEEFLPKFQDDGHHLARPVVDWSNTLDESYAKQEIQEILNEALEQLKPIDKSVVVLSDLEGMSDKEIAAALRVTVSAVKTRLHRARLFLRGKLAVSLGHSAA